MHTSYVDIVTVSPQLRLLTQLTATAGRTGGGGGGGGGGTTTATTTTTSTKGAVTTAKSPVSVQVPSVPQGTPRLTKLKRSSSLHSESSSHSYASDCGLVGVGIRGFGGVNSRSGRGRSSGRGSGTRTSSDCTVQIIMATQFVKWWKTKFQTMQTTTCGYKNISVLGSDTSDGRPSDTEDLVRDDASSSCNVHGAHVNPGLVASSTSSQHSHDHHLDYSPNEVKFEDFECDVHVEGSESGEERKEFSFTFYDLDGHGKITKDDIAGLVRSIYGAVNDSITVPQGGKKTIKVRLTVTPEKGKYDCGGVSGGKNSSPSPNVPSQNNNNNNNNNNNTTTNNNNNNNNNLSAGTTIVMGNENSSRPNKLRNNVNVTIQENLNRDRKGEGGRRHSDKPKFNSVRLPNHLTCRGCRNLSPEIFRDCSASPLRNRKKWRERACSAQRPDLFELLQANMEKNNVTPCCRQPHHHNSPPLCSHNHLIDPTCPVLPLLNSNHNNNISPPTNNDNLCHSGKLKLQLEHTVCSPRNKFYDSSSHHHRPLTGGGGTGHQNHQCRKHGHHRSRSHDLSQNLFKYHLLSDRDQLFPSSSPHTPNTNSPATALTISASAATSPPLPQTTQATSAPHSPKASSLCNNNHSCHNQLNQNEDALDLLTGCIFNHKNSNIVNSAAAAAAAASPHQLKHRNRKQEHARAMAQVISWLERENIGMEKKFSSPKKMPNPLPVTPPPVKKHEHHHVHEHIHHHYHHYAKETPIIV